MTWSVLLGLSSGLCWGAADFVGGLQSRRLPSLAVALWSQLVGGLTLLGALLLLGPVVREGALWGVAAGLCGGLALVLFYRALAIGTMSLVAPVSACGAVVPVLVGLAQVSPSGQGPWPGWVQPWPGLCLPRFRAAERRRTGTSARPSWAPSGRHLASGCSSR